MEFESAFLKIKRDFTHDEAVNFLNKEISELQIEIGKLKSELSECRHELHKAKNSIVVEGKKTKKEWLKDDFVDQFRIQNIKLLAKLKLSDKSLSDYRNKYYSLVAQNSKK